MIKTKLTDNIKQNLLQTEQSIEKLKYYKIIYTCEYGPIRQTSSENPGSRKKIEYPAKLIVMFENNHLVIIELNNNHKYPLPFSMERPKTRITESKKNLAFKEVGASPIKMATALNVSRGLLKNNENF